MPQPVTDLDKRILEMANKNWDQFVDLIGEEAIIAAKICLLRQEKRSYGEIMLKLKISRQKVRTSCKKCD